LARAAGIGGLILPIGPAIRNGCYLRIPTGVDVVGRLGWADSGLKKDHLGKDRSAGHYRHSIASAKWASIARNGTSLLRALGYP
jgi:hypothetical protein